MIVSKDQTKPVQAGGRWIVVSGVLALVSLGGWLGMGRWIARSPEPVAVQLVTVEPGLIETTINESGTVELGGQQTITSPVEGAVEQVLVKPGDRVTAGQTLILLRNPDRQTALLEQQLQIRQQQVTLARSQQQITEAREQLTAEQEQLQTLTNLAQVGAISQERVQEQATQVRNTLKTLRDAEAATSTATLELRSLELQRQRTERELADSVITAPLDGVVLSVNINNGDGVELRTELMTLGDPRQELVKLQLSTLNAAQVRPNQLARISVIGPDATVYEGRVQSLYPQAIAADGSTQSRPGSSQQDSQSRVPMTVQLNRPTGRLIPGSQVNVELVLAQRQNVLTLDVEAVQRDGQDAFVWVMDEDRTAQRQLITVGLESLTDVEVTAGLRAGDRVVVPSLETPLRPGLPLMPEATQP